MRLYGYISNSGTLGKDLQSWGSLDLNGNKPFMWLDNPLGGYEDIHTIELINTYGFNQDYDYKFVRDAIKEIVLDAGSGDEEQGFSALLDDQKVICSKLKIGTFNQRKAVLGISDLISAMTDYRAKTEEARLTRGLLAEVQVRNRLPNDDEEVFLDAGQLLVNYKMFGIDGLQYGDNVVGVGDYVNNNGPFLLTGLRTKNFTPEDMSLNDFCDLLIDILIHGKF